MGGFPLPTHLLSWFLNKIDQYNADQVKGILEVSFCTFSVRVRSETLAALTGTWCWKDLRWDRSCTTC